MTSTEQERNRLKQAVFEALDHAQENGYEPELSDPEVEAMDLLDFDKTVEELAQQLLPEDQRIDVVAELVEEWMAVEQMLGPGTPYVITPED